MGITHILAATDLSQGADEGLRVAGEWARKFNARLTVCHVVPDILRSAPPLLAGTAFLEALQNPVRVEKAEVAVRNQVGEVTGLAAENFDVAVVSGTPDRDLIAQAEKLRADLIVLSSSGHTWAGEWLLGSVAEQVVRDAHCPVLVARPSPVGKILAATDGCEPGSHAVETAGEIASVLGSKLAVVQVLYLEEPIATRLGLLAGGPVPTYQPEARRLLHRLTREQLESFLNQLKTPGEAIVVEGHPASTICQVAREQTANVVVVGTRGATGSTRLFGSVAAKVARSASCSVLVVR